ncbi:helix-turn-helix transcriptional regulator [Gordonia sp. ABSL49_1]|uniref:helix-turn-helix domain-containing protein n=1 Tax=Gordonia sp. ABSL49_1 TaxID=2920941 RepID=UPI001F1170B7|nr:helix-turn-helix transcriptional regulator [Gordonia sp. ABSL49_1]MCH5641723.1 AraC family transcriptional regulator [Gordonia sp. ABSL49_1]
MTEVYGGPRAQTVASHVVPPYLSNRPQVSPSVLDRDRVDRWIARFAGDSDAVQRYRGRRGMNELHGPLRISSTDPDGFEALMYAERIGAIEVINGLSTACSVRRIAPAPADEAALVLLINSASGSVTSPSGRDRMDFRAGQLVVLSSLMLGTVTLDDVCETIQLRIPMVELGEEVAANLSRFQHVSPDTALVRAVTTFLRRLAQADSTGNAGAAATSAAQGAAVNLVKAVLAQELYQTHRLDDTNRTVRARAQALIEQRFRDPEFAAPQLSRELHVSRRQMYRHFSAAGESLADLIANRRLQEVRSVLLAQPRKRLDEVARAAGFASTSAMRNRFRLAFGMTPAEFRSRRPDRESPTGRAVFGDVFDTDSSASEPDDQTVQSGE